MPRKFQFTKLLTGRPCVRFLPGFDCFSPVARLLYTCMYVYVYMYGGVRRKIARFFWEKGEQKEGELEGYANIAGNKSILRRVCVAILFQYFVVVFLFSCSYDGIG